MDLRPVGVFGGGEEVGNLGVNFEDDSVDAVDLEGLFHLYVRAQRALESKGGVYEWGGTLTRTSLIEVCQAMLSRSVVHTSW